MIRKALTCRLPLALFASALALAAVACEPPPDGPEPGPTAHLLVANADTVLASSDGAASPESASAINRDGGTMAARVTNPGGDAVTYDLELAYACP